MSHAKRLVPIKGWIYVISNKAMPGLVKVGYSMKDPTLRAADLSHTGAPHPYEVEYDALVADPRLVEGQAHRKLASMREGREWFRCTPEHAVSVLQEVMWGTVLLQTFHRVDRERTEALRREREAQARQSVEAAVRIQAFQQEQRAAQRETVKWWTLTVLLAALALYVGYAAYTDNAEMQRQARRPSERGSPVSAPRREPPTVIDRVPPGQRVFKDADDFIAFEEALRTTMQRSDGH